MAEPIMIRKLELTKSELNHVEVFAGLDRGGSLTKIIYVDKKDGDYLKDQIPLTVALFHNNHFEEALIWMKQNGVFPNDKSLKMHVTGVGGVKYSSKVKEIVGHDIQFMDEFLCQSRGTYYLLKNVPIDQIMCPQIELEEKHILSIPFTDSMRHQYLDIVGEEVMNQPKEQILPCVFGFMGSGGGFTYIGENGKFRMVAGLPTAGKTFMGLSKLILGTNKYDEIIEMATRGNKKNIDGLIKDYVDEIPDYNMSPSLSIFSFGKLAETKKSIKEFNKDDIANSLVYYFVQNALNTAVHVAMSEKVKNIVFGGNLFQGEIFRKEFEYYRQLINVDFINFHFLNNGHTAALGAMVSQPDDMGKYFEM